MQNNSSIKFHSLAGIDQKQPGMYIFETKDSIFIFDAGISIKADSQLAKSLFIPNYNYLLNNRHKIKGIFLTTPKETYSFAVFEFSKIFPEIQIFLSENTKILLDSISEKRKISKLNNFKIVNSESVEQFLNIEFSFIEIKSTYPGTLAIVIKENNERILYAPTYIFSEEIDSAFKNLNPWLLIVSTEQYKIDGYLLEQNSLDSFLESLDKKSFTRKGYITLYLEDFQKIMEVIKYLNNLSKKIVFFGKDISFIEHNFKHYVNDYSNYRDADFILIIENENEIFETVDLITTREEKISFFPNSTFISLTEGYAGYEKRCAKTLDNVAAITTNITDISYKNSFKNVLLKKDVHNLIKITKPRYVLPINSLFMNAKFLKQDLEKENPLIETIVLNNGEINLFENHRNKNLIGKNKELDFMVLEKNGEELKYNVFQKRNELSENGVAVFCASVDSKTKVLNSTIDVQLKGIVYLKNARVIQNKMSDVLIEVLKNSEKNWNQKQIKSKFEKEVMKIFRFLSQRQPEIILNIFEV